MSDDDEDDVYIPETDDELAAFTEKLIAAVSPDPERYGLTHEDVARLQEQRARWQEDREKARLSAEAARIAGERVDAAEAARAAHTTKGGKDWLGPPVLWVPYAPRYRTSGTARTRPVVRVGVHGPLAHLLRFGDERTTEGRGLPEGVRWCEIRIYVGEQASSDPARYTFRSQTSYSPYVAHHDPEDAGKPVFYILRWLDAGLAPGPWSVVAAATIPGERG